MKAKTIGLWVLTAAVAAMFLFAGYAKLSGAPMMVANFTRWGLPLWFLTLTGAIEVAAAVLLLIPRVSFYGAALLVPTMIGAVATHVVHGEASASVPALVLLVASAFLAFARRPAFLRGAKPALSARA